MKQLHFPAMKPHFKTINRDRSSNRLKSNLLSIILPMALALVLLAPLEANPDLPAGNATFNGSGARDSGVVRTYNIPLTNFPETIYFSVRGADGGNADAGPVSNRDKFQGKGGGGAVATATFSVSSTAANALRPGGEIRVIVGNKGAHMQGGAGGTKVAAGGGGGSGVLYKGPEVNADWTPLIIAGGGGGGMTSSFSTQVLRIDGGNGQIGPIGSTPGSVFATYGGAGQSMSNRGEGGAGWLQGAFYGAGKGESSGGVGGASRYSSRNSSGGFGCGGGGGAGGEKVGTVTTVGGGGGGGHSGGGGGSTSQAGGGGGSVIDVRAMNDVTQSVTQRGGSQLNGSINIQPSLTTVPDANATPIITLVGANPQNVAFSATDAYTDPGATATDYYNNPIGVQTLSNNVNRAVSGQYQVVYEATDQYGQTIQKTRTVNVLAGSLRPTFNLLPSLIVTPTGSQSHSVISGFNAGWLEGGNSEQLVRYEITENSNAALFATAPGLSNSGDLSFAPKDNTVGTATLTIIAIDNGPDPSVVQSLPQQITITVSIAPEPAQFILGTDPLELGASVEFREDAAGLIVGTVLSIAPVSSPDLTYFLSGVDAGLFTLGESDGVLSFKTRPDYEAPTDAGADHIYDITVTTEDGVNSVPANLTINLLSAPPATFIVTNNADGGAGSLRWAIAQANNKAGADIISFDPAFFNVARTILLTNGDIVLDGPTTINGSGRNLLTIDGNGLYRCFIIGGWANLELNDLTLTNSAASVTTYFSSFFIAADAGFGGAIYNVGILTMNRVTITDCIAYPRALGTRWARGGAIYNTGTLTINECTLSNNVAESTTVGFVNTGSTISEGGAICNLGEGVVSISNSILTGNQALGSFTVGDAFQPTNWVSGGAIYNLGDLTLDNTIVSSNLCQALTNWHLEVLTRAWGGGVYNNGTLVVRNGCSFSDNTALADTADISPAKAKGGGIYSNDGLVDNVSTTSITDTRFSGNSAQIRNNTEGFAHGGGLFNNSVGAVVRGCQFTGNRVIANSTGEGSAYGGGIYTQQTLTLLMSTLSENTADATSTSPDSTVVPAQGGGIYCSGNMTLSQMTVVGNQCTSAGPYATADGGGIFVSFGAVTIRNTTVALNEVSGTGTTAGGGSGGGISISETATLDAGNMLVSGNVVAGNSGTFGPDVSGTVASAGFNLVGDPAGTVGLVASDLSGHTPAAIFVDSSSNGIIDVADLQNNGDPTDTLVLLSGGAATDAGSNSLIPIDPDTSTAFATDQRGTGFSRIFNDTVDIGAFELGPDLPPPAPIIDNTTVAENNTLVGTVSSSDPENTTITYVINGGDDQTLFTIDSSTGVLSFLVAPDFENPGDTGLDNIYEVQVDAQTPTLTTSTLFVVTVTNVDWVWSIGDFRAEFALNPDGSDDLKDQSNNGIANILYFLLGLGDPSNANPPVWGGDNSLGLPQLFQSPGNQQVYIYSVRRNLVGYTVVPAVSDDLTAWSNPLGDSPSFTPIKVQVFPMDAYYDLYIITYLSGSNAEYPDATIYPKLFFRVNASKND